MSDSVGKITLDLEVTSDLSKQVSAMSNKIGANLKETMNTATKSMFDGMNKSMDNSMKTVNSSLKSGLGKMKETIKSTLASAFATAKTIKLPTVKFPKFEMSKPVTNNAISQPTTRGPPIFNSEALKAQMDNVTKTLDNTNAKIEQQQAKLAGLKESYNNTFNDNRKNAIQEKILKTESAINSLISKSDKLGFKLADLDAQFASAGAGASEASSKINNLSNKTKDFTSKANGSLNIFKKLGSSLKGLGSSANSTGKSFNGMQNGMAGIARQFVTWMIILPIIMKGLSSMASGLLANLNTNQQFANSLAQVKTNLMVAFTPIYYAILPAINAFMSSLATLTTYIASFISSIFGKTYQESFQATQGLIDAKKAMGAYGDSAKKAAKDALGLAGIDEINNLSKSGAQADDSKVPVLTQPSLDTSAVDTQMSALADKIKNIFGQIFAPMKQAWDSQGKATIDALKYALDSIWELTKDIGKSFLDVWTNGTGKKVCEDILKLLQTIFGIIGDIASAFKIAWDNGGLGTALVQAIFDALDAVLQLLNTIGTTFRDVWNSGLGVEICTNILEILKNIFTIIGQIATSFKTAWDSGLGKQLVTDILNLLNGILKVIKDITSSFSKAWKSNGDTICGAILLILDNIVGTISDITNKWSNAWENNGNGDTLMQSLLSTLGKILTTIGDIGQGMRESIGKVADSVFPTIIQFAKNVSDGLGNIADGFKSIWDNGGQHLFDGIVNLIAKVGELILKITGGAFKDASGIFKDILAPAIGTVFDVVGTLIDKLAEFTDWINNNKTLIDILSAALVGIGTALAGAKIASLLGEAVGALKIFGSAMKFVFSEGIISGIVDLGGALVAAVGGWPIIIGAAIIAIGVLIYTHWDEIKAKTSEIWNSIGDWLSNKWEYIKNVTSNAWQGIKDFFAKWGVDILAFFIGGPVALINVELVKHWDEIKAKTSEIWNNITGYLGEKWENLKTWASEKFGAIKESISTKWEETKTDASTKWENIKTSLSQKWESIKTSSSTTWDSVKKYISDKWTEINNDAPGLWDKIKTTLSGKWSEISTDSQTVWNGVVDFINNVFSGNWSKAWDGIKDTFKKVWESFEDIARAPVNAIIGLMNGLITGINTAIKALNKIDIDIPDWVPKIGGKSFGFNLSTIGSIPALATGGVIDSPTLAMVGEAGKEAVMPLENNTGWISELASKIAGIMGASSNSVSTSNESGDIIFMLDGNVLGKVAIKQLLKMKKQGYDLSGLI